jgi:uncharacterized protein YkwD
MRNSLQAAIGVIVVFILIGSSGLLLGNLSEDSTNNSNVTPTEQAETATQSVTATPSSTEPMAPETETRTASPEQNLTLENIETLIEKRISNHPDSTTSFSTDTKTAVKLDMLAKNHSKDMVQSGTVSHDVGNGDSEARYRKAELYQRCQFQEQEYIANAKRNRFESVARVSVDEYRGGSAETTEKNVANVIVEDWFNSITYRDRLRYENAQHLGVGVEISKTGNVYATATVC